MALSKPQQELESWIRPVLAFDGSGGSVRSGRFLVFGPARSFRQRGNNRGRVDWTSGDDAGELAQDLYARLDGLAADGPGSVYVICYVEGANDIQDTFSAQVVSLDGEEDDMATPEWDPVSMPGDHYAMRMAGQAISANTKIALTMTENIGKMMPDLVTFAHKIGELEGSLAEAAKAQSAMAQSEMVKSVMPSLDRMVVAIAAAVASGRKAPEDLGEQPAALGEERVQWDLAAIENLMDDILRHFGEAKEAFTAPVITRLKGIIGKVKQIEPFLAVGV